MKEIYFRIKYWHRIGAYEGPRLTRIFPFEELEAMAVRYQDHQNPLLMEVEVHEWSGRSGGRSIPHTNKESREIGKLAYWRDLVRMEVVETVAETVAEVSEG